MTDPTSKKWAAEAAGFDSSSPQNPRTGFLLRRLHSLTGALPVGIFLVEHLLTNATALGGQAHFTQAVEQIQRIPFLPWLEVFGIFLPLSFHAFYGIAIAARGRPNLRSYPSTFNWLYFVQRLTGIITFLFIAYHLYEYRIQKWLFGMPVGAFYGMLSARLSATSGAMGPLPALPWFAFFYLLGIFSAVFHLANGLWAFCFSWGIATSRAAIRRLGYASLVLGLFLLVIGEDTVLFFATGSSLFARSEEQVRILKVKCPPK